MLMHHPDGRWLFAYSSPRHMSNRMLFIELDVALFGTPTEAARMALFALNGVAPPRSLRDAPMYQGTWHEAHALRPIFTIDQLAPTNSSFRAWFREQTRLGVYGGEEPEPVPHYPNARPRIRRPAA